MKYSLMLTLIIMLDVNHIDYSTTDIYENTCLLNVSMDFIMWMNYNEDPDQLASLEAS